MRTTYQREAIKAIEHLATIGIARIAVLENDASFGADSAAGAEKGFIKLLGEHARGVTVTQVFPNEHLINYPFIKEAQELAKAKGLKGISPAMMEGFAAAKILVEGLRHADPKPTPAGLRDAPEGLRKFDMGGPEVSYSPTDHSGLDFADLSIIDSNGKFKR